MVSIIVPVYNREKCIRTCLDSILAQTYGDYEVIIIDDGSTDSSVKICNEYCEKDTRFSVFSQPNQGVASARNNGVQRAAGEYIFFVDSDDCINQRTLEYVVDIAKKYQAKIVQFNMKMVDADFSDYTEEIPCSEKVQKFSVVEALWNLECDDRSIPEDLRIVSSVVWGKLYVSEILKNNPFPDHMRIHEDQMKIHHLYKDAETIFYINLPLYYYKKSDNSLIRVGWNPDRLVMLDCYEDRINMTLHLDGEKKQIQDIANHIAKRYMIAIIRNYELVEWKMESKAEKKKIKKDLQKRMKKGLKYPGVTYRTKMKLVFVIFSLFPDICVFGDYLYKKIKR